MSLRSAHSSLDSCHGHLAQSDDCLTRDGNSFGGEVSSSDVFCGREHDAESALRINELPECCGHRDA
jgi:hypothetical protein